jgi:SAM-dependent methyltransferase
MMRVHFLNGFKSRYRKRRHAPSWVDFLARSKNLLDRTEVLQQRFGNTVTPEFLNWVETKGILVQRELQSCGVPFPEWEEMVTVGGEVNLEMFLDVGKQTLDWIQPHLPDFDSSPRILDFGVGCARTSRHLFRFSEKIDLYGCDVDREAIKYCKENVTFMEATASNNLPPLAYNSDFFNGVFSISVFSHLTEFAFESWMNEIHRCLKVGGIFAFTFHGSYAYHLIESNKLAGPLVIGNWENTYNPKRDFETEFLWLKQIIGSKDIDSHLYGISFTSQNYIMRQFSELFDLIYFQEGIGNWQDLIVLRKI